MQVSKEGIERIRQASPLAQVLAERGIDLRRKGKGLVGLCPFHKEKTPSFSVSADKGLFKCFGCGASGDVIGFLIKYEKVSFPVALESLARRAGLELKGLMETRPRPLRPAPAQVLTSPSAPRAAARAGAKPASAPAASAPTEVPQVPRIAPAELLARVVDHYHRIFCERADAQAYLKKRGLTDADLWRAHRIGYADGSFLKLVPRQGELKEQLLALGVITTEGRELLGGCIVVPLPDPLTGQWVNLYGRGMRTPRHCYLPGPLRGILNFQAAKTSDEVVLTESVIDTLSFHQAGVATAIPIYGTNGFTAEHLDLLKREQVRRVILALDGDAAGRKATDVLKEKLTAAGIAVRVMPYPMGIKDANELLASRNGDAGEAFRRCLHDAEPWPGAPASEPAPAAEPARAPADRVPAAAPPAAAQPGAAPAASTHDGTLTLKRDDLTYKARVQSTLLGRLKVTVKAFRGESFHADTLDLYASRARTEFAKRAAKALSAEVPAIESALLALLVEAEKAGQEEPAAATAATAAAAITDAERAEATAFLQRPDILDQVARDIDALGYVGEETNKRLLYLVAISRKQDDPLSAIVLSQSGAGKSGLTEVIEKLTPPEDVVLFTRLTPQSLYYTEPGYLDHKLVIVEERYGSAEADYSIRVLQSRKKLIAAAPVKDPQTGNLRTRVFTVEARAAFIEATTASSVNHENATRCFELAMDESAEQTARIHARQRLLKTERGLRLRQESEAIRRRHWNAQRLLEPLPVVIPYAEQIAFPTAWMRTRRDHARFLNLIEVVAFLHQHQREKRCGGVVASLDDYAAAYGLAAHVLSDTLSDVRRPLKEALERVRALSLKGDGTVSRREVREALAVPDSTVRRWLCDLVELEYLAQVEHSKGGQGKATRYRVVEREPRTEAVAGLLAPEDLAKRLEARP